LLFPTLPRAADRDDVAKTLGLLSLLAALAIVGYLITVQARTTGPTSAAGQQAQAEAAAQASAASFQAAAPVLQAWHAERGTYAGAKLPPALGVALVRADDSSYCLQAGSGTAAQHLVGPGGTPPPGSC
jgi:hypothetical protein